MFTDRLIEKIGEKNNPSVVGLDPKIEYIPDFLKKKVIKEYGNNLIGAAKAILIFNKMIIDYIYDIVAVVKPQLAYYEMYGIEGMKVFKETIDYAKSKGLLVIADAKRNDIGTTSKAYSDAFIGKTNLFEGKTISVYDVDALTVNPYFGIDGIKPFVDDCIKYNKGIFVLAKTSNKSSGQLQDLIMQDGKKNYEIVADLLNKWGKETIGKNNYSNVGAVVGATYPDEANILRKILKNNFILVPGYGAQGGTAKDVVNSFNEDGLGALVNASRSVICAYKSDKYRDEFTENSFCEAARAEVINMRDDILNELNKAKKI